MTTAKFCDICFASFALVGKAHNCNPRSRPSWLPPDKAEREPKLEPPKKATRAQTIKALKQLCKQPPAGRAAATDDDVTDATVTDAVTDARSAGAARQARYCAKNPEAQRRRNTEAQRRRRARIKGQS